MTVLLLAGGVLMLLGQALAQTAPLDLTKLRALRREAAHRPRRMIFNNDGDDVIYTKKEPTPEALLALRTTPLLGSQVDSIFYSNSMCFGWALHNSAVFPPFTSREDLCRDNAMPDYLRVGLDPIKVMADFGHAHGIEVFWDMRMNDTHDAGLTGYGPIMLPQLKKDHPEYLVGAPDKQPPYGTWSSVNYAVPEVRELCYRFFEEVCQRFDVDGVELDFFRHACFFKSVAWGGEASEEERAMMTDLVRRIRAMTERESLRRGRPILVAIRVPDSVEYSRAIGLDVERWLQEGLVDLLSGTCYFQLNPWEYLIGLGHKYDVPVYPSLSDSRVLSETRFQRRSLESYRGRAANAWAAGADGIYLFNYFNPNGPIWRELGDPQALKTKDKLYFLTVRNGPPDSYLKDGARFRTLPVVSPMNGHLLELGRPKTYDLYVAEDVSGAVKPQVTCHVRAVSPAPPQVKLNDQVLGQPTVQDDWYDYPVPLTALKLRRNQITLAAPDAVAAANDSWTIAWDSSKLPGPAWQRVGGAKGCVIELQDGKLLIADRSTVGDSYHYFRYPAFIDPAQETVIEARLKTISGESSILVENGFSGDQVQFFPDHVCMRHARVSTSVRTDDDFHTYRIVTRGHDLLITMDGKLILDGTGKFTNPAPAGGRSGMMFGASNSGTLGEGLWESVRVRNPAVTLLDVVLSVDYPE
jgi:hypothetical protein